MADKDLTIRLRLDRSHAKADAAANKADLKRTEVEIVADADAAEKAKSEAARRTNRERIAGQADVLRVTHRHRGREGRAARPDASHGPAGGGGPQGRRDGRGGARQGDRRPGRHDPGGRLVRAVDARNR